MPKRLLKSRKKSRKKRVGACFYCLHGQMPDYKDVTAIRQFLTSRGKVVPRRGSGFCAKHQRKFSTAVKRARNVALI